VKIAIGSDWSDTSLPEAMNLYELGVFDNKTLLNIWCHTTPSAIFPERNIGQLKEGFEASFIVLDAKPLDDFENVKNIRLRFKQGCLLQIENDQY
jgi:predicted amidohydrolase YtcJ